MSITVGGVPKSIKRSDLDALIAAIGIGGDDLVSLNVGYHSIEAEVLARDERGARYRGSEGRGIARHLINIPVVD